MVPTLAPAASPLPALPFFPHPLTKCSSVLECQIHGVWRRPLVRAGVALSCPRQVSLTESGSSCVKDLDFVLEGFATSGAVALPQGCSIPAATAPLTVHLKSQGQAGAAGSLTVAVNPDGTFAAPAVIPGTYDVTVSHPSWAVSTTSVPLTVAFGPAVVPSGLTVLGFSVAGAVVSSSGAAVSDVSVYLFAVDGSAGVAAAGGCVAPDTSSTVPAVPGLPAQQALCVQSSDASGKYAFHGLACGKYVIVPSKEVRRCAFVCE